MKKALLLMCLALVLVSCSERNENNIELLPEGVYKVSQGQTQNITSNGFDPDGGPIVYTWFLYKFEYELSDLEQSEWMLLGELPYVPGQPGMEIKTEEGFIKFEVCSLDELGGVGCTAEEAYQVLDENNYFGLEQSMPGMKELIKRNEIILPRDSIDLKEI